MVERLDEQRIEALRAWATALAADGREDLRAAGRAIILLIAEIERLQTQVTRTRDTNPSLVTERTGEATDSVEAVSSQSLGTSLRERIGVALSGRATPGLEE